MSVHRLILLHKHLTCENRKRLLVETIMRMFCTLQVNYLVYEGQTLDQSAWCSIPFNEETSGDHAWADGLMIWCSQAVNTWWSPTPSSTSLLRSSSSQCSTQSKIRSVRKVIMNQKNMRRKVDKICRNSWVLVLRLRRVLTILSDANRNSSKSYHKPLNNHFGQKKSFSFWRECWMKTSD